MGIGKDYFHLLRTHGGIAGDYLTLNESDFAVANGAAYTPPEENNEVFRRINVSRTIQLLAQCPVTVVTYQTSVAKLRLPANTVSDITNDSGNGRLLIFDNKGTGNIEIQDYLGVTIVLIAQDSIIILFNMGSNQWGVFKSTDSVIKSGSVPFGSFTGNPKIYDVVFASPFPNDNYSVTITGYDSRSWYIENILATGFRINSSANQPLTGLTHWHASYNG